MFRRDVKIQFNENKYNLLTMPGPKQTTHITKLPFQKQLIGSIALIVIGYNYTKRYKTMPHHHKEESKPMTLSDGSLHPYEFTTANKVSAILPKINLLTNQCVESCRSWHTPMVHQTQKLTISITISPPHIFKQTFQLRTSSLWGFGVLG